MRRVRVLGVDSDDKPLLQHRHEVIPIEVNPALDPDHLACGEDLAHGLAHRLLMAVADHVPVVRVAAYERVAAPRLLVADLLVFLMVDSIP